MTRMGAVVVAGLAVTGTARAQGPIPPKAEQIAAAVLPMPEEFRAGAKVYGYGPDGKFIVLREGKGMHCLAQYPREKQFHVSCYHESLEPLMGRGRELRAGGTPDNKVDSVRYAEIAAGKLALPEKAAALYQLFGGTFDPAAKTVAGARRLYVVYVPFATAASTGLPEKPHGNDPWLMSAGTPKAHIMFAATM